jgi:hypothetical protein
VDLLLAAGGGGGVGHALGGGRGGGRGGKRLRPMDWATSYRQQHTSAYVSTQKLANTDAELRSFFFI